MHDGDVFSDDGHGAFVPVGELRAEADFAFGVGGGFEAGFFFEEFGDVFAGLGGGGGEAGDLDAVFID